VIVAYSVRARDFSEPELELIELLGGQAALALETARLRAEQEEVIHELSRANRELRRGRAVLEWAEQQHHQLMQLVLDEVELPGLVSALAATLQASVTVEDAEGRVLASAPAALALDAELVAVGPAETRTIPVAEFLQGPFTTALQPDEILTEIRLPVWQGGHAFVEYARIHANFAAVAAAALVTLDGGQIQRAAVALTGVAPDGDPRPGRRAGAGRRRRRRCGGRRSRRRRGRRAGARR
jgi:FAD binding domain in molybdopterin dehydrogenase